METAPVLSADIAKNDWLAQASKSVPSTKRSSSKSGPKGMDNSLLLDDDPMFQL